MNGILHLRHDDVAYAVDLRSRHIEVEFVMHLHDHLRLQFFFFEAPMDRDHRHLDDVGSGALDRCVDRIAFGERTDRGILRVDVRQVTLASEEGLGVTALTGYFFLILNVIDHPREGSEIVINELFGFGARAVKLLRQTERGNAVDNTEIGCFGTPPLLFADLVNGQSKDFSRRCRMNCRTAKQKSNG